MMSLVEAQVMLITYKRASKRRHKESAGREAGVSVTATSSAEGYAIVPAQQVKIAQPK